MGRYERKREGRGGTEGERDRELQPERHTQIQRHRQADNEREKGGGGGGGERERERERERDHSQNNCGKIGLASCTIFPPSPWLRSCVCPHALTYEGTDPVETRR